MDYSLKFNSSTTSQNLEIKFRFDPAVESADIQDKLVLSFQEVVDNLRKAVDANTINSLKDRVEEVEGTASIK